MTSSTKWVQKIFVFASQSSKLFCLNLFKLCVSAHQSEERARETKGRRNPSRCCTTNLFRTNSSIPCPFQRLPHMLDMWLKTNAFPYVITKLHCCLLSFFLPFSGSNVLRFVNCSYGTFIASRSVAPVYGHIATTSACHQPICHPRLIKLLQRLQYKKKQLLEAPLPSVSSQVRWFWNHSLRVTKKPTLDLVVDFFCASWNRDFREYFLPPHHSRESEFGILFDSPPLPTPEPVLF